MGLLGNALLVFVGLILFLSVKIYREALGPVPKPELDVKAYWGPGDVAAYKEDTTIHPFKISYSEEVIKTLKAKLEDFPDLSPPLEGVNFEYGFNTDYLKQVVKYWREDYLGKWNLREKYFNKFPHFKTNIQGLDIHFIHVKPNKPTKPVLPLLLLHGWPGSVVEFYSLLDKLKANEEYDFELVVPSLPGYGWSQASAKTGLGPVEMGVVLRNLMIRLGHQKFYIQGGDWGSLIGSSISTFFPENVIGYHSNLCVILTARSSIKMLIGSIYPSYFIPEEYINWYYPLWPSIKFSLEETGYLHIQATKPDTIGTALSTNPIGLAAYILEKFSTGVNRDYRNLPDGGLSKRISMDAILDNLMVYYLTNSITTAKRLYAEGFSLRTLNLKIDRIPTVVPTGCGRFRHDILHSFDWILKDKFENLVHSSYNTDGGHFAAMEVPDLLYKDFLIFLRKVENNAKVNSEL
ncbi:Epoxide hydrolase [Sergentomyia squamirostris]